jgi:hypothetical protein
VDPTVVVVLGVLWFLFNLLSGGKKRSPPPRAQYGAPDRPDQPSLPDATQREGSRLELVLREFQRALEEGRGPEYLEEEVEERQSLETEPEVVSLEQEVRRAPRQRFTQDEDAESLVKRRITAAASRDARTKADHIEFDQRIRKEPADQTATLGYTAKQLRDAVVWREILGPPVSLRSGQSESSS